MKLTEFINRLGRMVTNRLMKRGVDKAIRTASGKDAKPTPQQRQRDKQSREAVKRARQAARITRRMK